MEEEKERVKQEQKEEDKVEKRKSISGVLERERLGAGGSVTKFEIRKRLNLFSVCLSLPGVVYFVPCI